LSDSIPTHFEPNQFRAIPRSWWWNALVGLGVAALLPVVGHALRGNHSRGCAWDGLPLEPIYRVRIIERPGATREFCSVRCAELWLRQCGCRPSRILVTDEAGGGELDASAARYVRSTVPTNPVTGNRVHVFRTEEAASRHAAAARGRSLAGAERPFSAIPGADSGSL
jgi:hypothetical protein